MSEKPQCARPRQLARRLAFNATEKTIGSGWLSAAVLLFIVATVTSSACLIAPSLPNSEAGALAASSSAAGLPTPPLAAAEEELQKGAGPAEGNSVSCLTAGTSTANCGATPSEVPSSDVSVPGFQPASAATGALPSLDSATLAWDEASQEAVFFGGTGTKGVSDQTWVFHEGTWANVTNLSSGPPPRSGAMMAYDNQTGVDAIVLFGGCDPGIACPRNDTWLFSGGVWNNVTGAIGPQSGRINAAMTTWGNNGTLLFGGCTEASCGTQANTTWAFQNTSACEAQYGRPCWNDLSSGGIHGASPPALAGVAMGDDLDVGPTDGEVVLYGGFSTTCPTCAARDSNATWLFNGNRWTDATSSYAGSPYPNEARSHASLFWDPTTRSLWLYGGINDSSGVTYSELWSTDVLSWANESLLRLPDPVRTGAAVATGLASSDFLFQPILVGGVSPENDALNDTWVFEPSITLTPTVAPNPVEANAPALLQCTTAGGTAPTVTWTMGDGGSVLGSNGTYVYRDPGTYVVHVNALDWFGVQNQSNTLNVVVQLFSLGLSVPTVTDESGRTHLSVDPSGGSPPYNATWVLSDGTVLYGPGVEHNFSELGTQDVNVTVRDAVGTVVTSNARIKVNPTLAASARADPPAVDVNMGTELSVTESGGTPPYLVEWSFPNGRTGAGHNTTYRPTEIGPANVTVLLIDSANVSWTTVLSLAVNPALLVRPSTSVISPTTGRAVTFAASISGGTAPYAYSWEFGDGGTSTSGTPSHTYGRAGSFTVTVWVNDSVGGSAR
ncbi:MAG: PKD domain-containing protein, partial [Thermoplasmata archaeon]